jgi:archaellum biogenesis ATPase FlaH
LRIEETILRNLIYNEEYTRKVLPFLDNKYFHDFSEKVLFEEVAKHVATYNNCPTRETLEISLGALGTVSEDQFKDLISSVEVMEKDKDNPVDIEWLLAETEKFCQDKALYNAIMGSIEIIDDNKKTTTGTGEIPKMLSDALSVSFDPNVGHDYIEDSEERFEYYHTVEERIPFDLDLMNKITKGGLPKKSLNVIMAGTGVGKSLFMCHCAGANLNAGLNVLYITLEMAEERIAERIDANLLDVEVVQLATLKRDQYLSHIDSIRNKTVGKLIVKEYPTAVAHVGHFRHLLNELNLKKSFRPDIVYVDYLNICSSSRIKPNANANSYTLVKSIAEELRGLAVENNIPVVTATQTNRQGFTNSDVDLTDTAESFGLPATADFMVALISNEEMEELGQLLVKQLKNRYNDPTKYRRFVVGVDRDKMRVYDAEDSAQDDLFDSPNDDDDTGDFFSGSIGSNNISRRFEGVV